MGGKPSAPVSVAEERGPAFALPVSNIANYVVVKKLGQGVFGEVFHVRDKDGNDLALKQIYCPTGDSLQHALFEASLLKALKHENIVKYKDYQKLEHKSHTVVCITMELVNGMNLDSFLMNHPEIDLALVMVWFISLLDALSYMHASKVVHRDLKPANIMITEEGTLKIVDFGVSGVLKKDYLQTFAGTPAYAAPELFQLENRRYDGRADVWSLGCILFQTVSGKTLREPMQLLLAKDPTMLSRIKILMAGVTTIAPPNTRFLLPFVSSLGSKSSFLRGNAIRYLSNWIKNADVHKVVGDFGIEGLSNSLKRMRSPSDYPEFKKGRMTQKVKDNLLILEFMLQLCEKSSYKRRCAFELYAHGAVKKAVELCYSGFAAADVKHTEVLTNFLIRVFRNLPIYCAVNKKQSIEHLLSWWFSSSGLYSIGAMNMFKGLPQAGEEADLFLKWWDVTRSVSKKPLYDFLNLCEARKTPSDLPNQANIQLMQEIFSSMSLDNTSANVLLRLLRADERWMQHASIMSCCTVDLIGTLPTTQYLFHCKTCWPDKPEKGCCLSCLQLCHDGHKIKIWQGLCTKALCNCREGISSCKATINSVLPPILQFPAAVSTTTNSTVTRLSSGGRLLRRSSSVVEVGFVCPKNREASLYQFMEVDTSRLDEEKPYITAYYYEVKILKLTGTLSLGLCATTEEDKAQLPGLMQLSCGYHSDDGKRYEGGKKTAYYGPPYGVGDVVGCGVTNNGSVYYTLNGFYLGIAFECAAKRRFLNGVVGKATKGKARVLVNTGHDFMFDHAKILQDLIEPGLLELHPVATTLIKDDAILNKVFQPSISAELQAHFLYILSQASPEKAQQLASNIVARLKSCNSSVVSRIIDFVIASRITSSLLPELVAVDTKQTVSIRGTKPAVPYLKSTSSFRKASHPEPLLSGKSSIADTKVPPKATPTRSSLPLSTSSHRSRSVWTPSSPARRPRNISLSQGIATRPSSISSTARSKPQSKYGSHIIRQKEDLMEENENTASEDISALLATKEQLHSIIASQLQEAVASTRHDLVPITVLLAHDQSDRRELVLTNERTMSSLKAQFSEVFPDISYHKIAKIEKLTASGPIKIVGDSNVAVLREGDVLIFHLSTND
ncbi:kinase that interacts with cdc31p [Balamuthia mandrillaris]